MLRKLARDPLVIKETRVDAVYGLVGLMDLAWAAAAHMPEIRCLYGGKEQVIDDEAAADMLRRLPQGPLGPRVALYPQGYHMLLRDLNAEVVRGARGRRSWSRGQARSKADLRAERLLVNPDAKLTTPRPPLPVPAPPTR